MNSLTNDLSVEDKVSYNTMFKIWVDPLYFLNILWSDEDRKLGYNDMLRNRRKHQVEINLYSYAMLAFSQLSTTAGLDQKNKITD